MCSNGARNIDHGFLNDLEMHVPAWEYNVPQHGNVLSPSGTCFKVHWNTLYMCASTCEHMFPNATWVSNMWYVITMSIRCNKQWYMLGSNNKYAPNLCTSTFTPTPLNPQMHPLHPIWFAPQYMTFHVNNTWVLL
jgi:hypothetical protein